MHPMSSGAVAGRAFGGRAREGSSTLPADHLPPIPAEAGFGADDPQFRYTMSIADRCARSASPQRPSINHMQVLSYGNNS
jgi:hypothetical protein